MPSTQELVGKYKDLRNLITTVKDTNYRTFLNEVYGTPAVYTVLPFQPAGRKNHQNWPGGLMEHITNLTILCRQACTLYPQLDESLLITACLVHDIGKVWEIEADPAKEGYRYSTEGILLGHITIGMQFLTTFKGNLEHKQWTHLMHVILSHHGRMEWGSPKTPMTREALTFHQMDCLDARLGTLDLMEKMSPDNRGFVYGGTTEINTAWFPEKGV